VNPWMIAAPVAIASVSALSAYGAAYPRAQLFGPTTCRTTSPRKLAITFDDGPNPTITPKLLDLLDRYDARATFFLIGRYARQCPDLMREISARGHAVGNHTETHPNLFWLGPAQIRDELRRCQDAIASALNARPTWFRPPWGLRNPWLAGAAREFELRTVMWTLIPGDWRAPTCDWLIERMHPIAAHASQAQPHGRQGHAAQGQATQRYATRTGDILCLHDGSHRGQNADRTRTLAALEYWLPRWRDLGLEFATIDRAVISPAS
jgi:peptidoglycan/xylan/chitin deacetylase (PgdA/CDA1 family)